MLHAAVAEVVAAPAVQAEPDGLQPAGQLEGPVRHAVQVQVQVQAECPLGYLYLTVLHSYDLAQLSHKKAEAENNVWSAKPCWNFTPVEVRAMDITLDEEQRKG